MNYQPGRIHDVICKPLQRFPDERGWLCEIFRQDELPAEFRPVMGYLSMTAPGVTRGPHEHVEQADCFAFLGPSNFEVRMWDARASSASYGSLQIETVGADKPMMIVIPVGVVHGYKNIGDEPGLVVNCPNRLFKGPGRAEPADEIRHEEEGGSVFRME